MSDEMSGVDFGQGVRLDTIPDDGMLAGHVGGRPALLVRRDDRLHVVGAICPHLGAPLAQGLVVGGELRCPWHHACFDLETGGATKAPAFDPLPVWPVQVDEGVLRVTAPEPRVVSPVRRPSDLGPFVVIGGGAAGYAAALKIKTLAPDASCVVLSQDDHAPYDRTLLTKDYLDGRFGEDRLPISRQDLRDLGVDVRLATAATRIDPGERTVVLSTGEAVSYGRLLIATGAEPRRPDLPGLSRDHVTMLRDLADCRGILARLGTCKNIVILGASFIGLEAAASLVSRGLSVTVVSPDREPLAKVYGTELAAAVVETHRREGTILRLGCKVLAIGPEAVRLDDGTELPADLVIVGVGVSPRTELAESAGLSIDDGVVVDRYLETSHPGIYAAGDIARWPDPLSGTMSRVEHWVVAQRQGQVAALNMLGQRQPYDEVPFFWTKHFDLSIRSLGQTRGDDVAEVDGDPAKRDATVLFKRDRQCVGAATMGRDRASLEIEAWMGSSAAAP